MRHWKTVAVLVFVTFIILICLGEINFMFWSVYPFENGGWNWVDIWWGDTPILQISLYNSFCIVWLGILLGLVLLWIYFFYAISSKG